MVLERAVSRLTTIELQERRSLVILAKVWRLYSVSGCRVKEAVKQYTNDRFCFCNCLSFHGGWVVTSA